MKAALLALAVATATLQTATLQQTGQRGQAPTAQAAPTAPLTAAQCKCSIEVTVKHAGTDEAISNIEVSLTSAITAAAAISLEGNRGQAAVRARNSDPVTITTDGSGRAFFHDLAEGTYTVQAKREGYFGVSNDSYPDQATAGVAVGPTNQAGARGAVQPVRQVALDMVQGAILTGRIQDENRRPASAVQVGAYRTSYQNGHRVLTLSGRAVQTDDRGEYRLFWFPPGDYYVRTAKGSGTAASRAAARDGNQVVQASYYRGTTDPKAAIPVVVRDGDNLTGIDITLQASSGITISGTITNTIPGGRPGVGGQVIRSPASMYLVPRNPYFWETPELLPIGGTAARAARGGNPSNDSEKAFEIHGLSPGAYDLYPVFNSGTGVGAEGSEARSAYFAARTTIEVGTENITGIQSVIRPGADLKGHIAVVGNPPAATGRLSQAVTLNNVRIQIQSQDNTPIILVARGTATAVDADGNFTVANLIDSHYFVSAIRQLPPDAYVSEIRQDGRSILDENVITIAAAAPSTLEITVSRGGGTIQGMVQDAKHNPVAGAQITLIPDMARRQNVLLYKTTNSNAMGGFNLGGFAPGTYKLFAWERIPAGAEQNSEYMREYDLLGVTVNVVAGLSLANIQLPLIPAKR